MDSLDINLPKDSESFDSCYSQSFYWRICKKTRLYSGFEILSKKRTRQLESLREWHFVDRKNVGRKLDD
jgi:hypothetical protein